MRVRSDGALVDGKPAWDPLLVFCRLKLMAEITRRCPLNARDIPTGFKSGMPEHVRQVSAMDYAAPRPLRPAIPNAQEISLRDETVQWIAYLEAVDRVILWGYAVGDSSRNIEGHLFEYLKVKLSYRSIQGRFNRLLSEVAETWQGKGYEVDGGSLNAADTVIGRQQQPMHRTPRAKGITFWQGDGVDRKVGESRVIMVDLPRPQHKKRGVGKSASQTSQIRA